MSVSQALTKFDLGGGLWALSEGEAKLNREEFTRGMLLLAAAQGRPFDETAMLAFWLALADQRTEDFVTGVRRALKSARYITPAAVVESCDEARRERFEREEKLRESEDQELGDWRRRYIERYLSGVGETA